MVKTISILWDVTRIFFSIVYDFLDLTIGRIPIFGTVFDIAGMFLGVVLWGVPGLLQGWELLDITDQFDGFIPTLTIVGTIALIKKYIL